MPTLGIKTFWKSAAGNPADEDSNQILKNDSYINITLLSAVYLPKGNFWQNTFGGSDNIALTTSLTYRNGDETIEATSLLNRKKIKIKDNNEARNLGARKIIAEKIPSFADSISMEFKMTAVKNDKLQEKFDMLNKPEYQAALQLVPKAVGQVLTITSLVKNLLTDAEEQGQIHGAFSGIISQQKEASPVKSGKLTKGMLIFINTDEGDPFSNIDESKFELRSGSALYYDNKEVENTFAVFLVSADEERGPDHHSKWFKKYTAAFGNLDEIRQRPNDKDDIYRVSQKMWAEGNTLLDADVNFLDKEKRQISNAIIADMDKKFKELTQPGQPIPVVVTNDILKGLTASTVFNTIEAALPATAGFLSAQDFQIDPNKTLKSQLSEKISISPEKMSELIAQDRNEYVAKLKGKNIEWNFGKEVSGSV